MILNLWVESVFCPVSLHSSPNPPFKILIWNSWTKKWKFGTSHPRSLRRVWNCYKTFSKCLLHYHPLKGWHVINVAFNNNRIATMVARDQFFHQMIFEGSRANPSAWSHVLLSRKLLIPQWLRQSSILPFPLAEWASPHPLPVLDTRSLASQIHT